MQRLAFVSVVILLSLAAGACGPKKPKLIVPPESPITSIEAVKASAEEKKSEELTPEENLVRRRAERIKAEEAEKKARLELQKADTPERRQARKELQKEEDRSREAEKAQADAKRRSGLTCRTPEEEKKVTVLSSATERGLGFVHSSMMIVHKGDIPVDIRQTDGGRGSGLVVKNMCPGGSLLLSKRLNLGDGYQIVAYSAVGKNNVGQAVTSYSPQIYLQACYSYGCRYEYGAIWEIRLQ